jgi:uncharacterized protein
MYMISIIIGIAAGILGGLFGIGGGLIIIPALTMFLGFSQHMSQGTTLAAMVPPIGILAAMEYYRNGNVDIRAALLISAGFIIGSFFGARFASGIDDTVLRKIFGCALLIISVKMIFMD